jgi:kynurenine formamidase
VLAYPLTGSDEPRYGRSVQPKTGNKTGKGNLAMADLASLAARLIDGTIEVVDLTSPLHDRTPILQLPPELGQTQPFQLEEISRYDDRGPAWYWNNFRTGEHTGTHLDAPNHWVTGRDLADVSQIPPHRLIGPAAVIDKAAQVSHDPDYLLDVPDLEDWQERNGELPESGWLLFRTGWSSRGDNPEAFANADDKGPHTPGVTPAAASYLAESGLLGFGVETVGTDAGQAFGFQPAFPCHEAVLGAGKYGLTQLRNLDRLPARGAIVIAAPLPIVSGSGSPARVLALVER